MHMNSAFAPDHAYIRLPRSEVVGIGSTVSIRDLHSGEVDIYTLVTPNQADITHNRISSLTPVGTAIYGRQVGETVDIEAPGGKVRFRIESIKGEPAASDALERK